MLQRKGYAEQRLVKWSPEARIRWGCQRRQSGQPPGLCFHLRAGSGYSWPVSNSAQGLQPLKLKVDPRLLVPHMVFCLAQSH